MVVVMEEAAGMYSIRGGREVICDRGEVFRRIFNNRNGSGDG